MPMRQGSRSGIGSEAHAQTYSPKSRAAQRHEGRLYREAKFMRNGAFALLVAAMVMTLGIEHAEAQTRIWSSGPGLRVE